MKRARRGCASRSCIRSASRTRSRRARCLCAVLPVRNEHHVLAEFCSCISHGRVIGLSGILYRALPSRRKFIQKEDGRERPLGIAALEDKIVQRAVVEVLNAIYEQDFLGFSYGFRPGRGQHNALDALAVGITYTKVSWIVDADVRSFLETSSYCPHVHEMLSNRSG